MAKDGYLYALNANTGAKLWGYFIGEQPLMGCSPAISNGYLYVGSKTNRLIALGPNSATTPFTLENLWMISVGAVAIVLAVTFFFALSGRKGQLLRGGSLW